MGQRDDPRGLRLRWCTVLWLGLLLVNGCGPRVEVIGLRQEHPGKQADSLQPTLSWETFGAAQLGLDPGRIRNVTYELRLWTSAREGAPLEVVYARGGLTAPQHRVETPLTSGRRYHWAVRARFELDGESQAIPWSAIVPKVPKMPGTSLILSTEWSSLEPASPSAYRFFTTPSQ